MRKSRYLLDRDLKDKSTAQAIDEHAIDLSLTNSSLYLKEGVTHINPRYVAINLCIYHMEKQKPFRQKNKQEKPLKSYFS